MSVTNASELLRIMAVRLKCQVDGVTDPPDDVKTATRVLVSELSSIDGNELIEVEINGRLTMYRQVSSGRVLATIESDSEYIK